MARKRDKKADDKLPPYTYFAKGRWFYKPYLGRSNGKTKFGKEIRLCGGDKNTPISDIWKAYEAKIQKTETDIHALKYLLTSFIQSPSFQERAKSTQAQYKGASARIIKTELADGSLFGDADFREVTPGTIRGYLDRRAEMGAPKSGNRERAFISAAYSWAYNRDKLPKGMINPCVGVTRNKEKSRDLYIKDAWYDLVYELAGARAWYIRPFMEMAYLCRMRRIEIRQSAESDILPVGFDTRRVKGSNDAITLWSNRLRTAVDTGLNRPRNLVRFDKTKSPIFTDAHGAEIKEEAFTTAWKRLMDAAEIEAKKREIEFTRFTFHDIKAKGASDYEGNIKDATGHKTDAAANVYDRKKNEVLPTR